MIDEKILKLCMRVNDLKAYYPQFNEVDSKPIESTPDMVGKYGWNNEIVAFVDQYGDYYVTPYCAEVTECLNKLGYENGYIYVPFSNWDEPADKIKAQEWKRLCVEAKELHSQKEKERKREEIKKLVSNRKIKKLDDETYALSMEVPTKGFEVSYYDTEFGFVRPVPNFSLGHAIGTYWHNNGRLIFVNDEGKTYLSPYYHELNIKLKDAGYREDRMYVPLSNGEEILDSALKEKWQKLCLGASEATKIRISAERRDELQKIAVSKGIKPLPYDVYKLSFFIPAAGVRTTWFEEKNDVTYPINEWSLNIYLGSYFQNNGKLVFVDDKGDTFVTPFANEINATLRAAGYRERSMYVPFSNGDVPTDKLLLLKWKQLCALARKAYKQREAERRASKLNTLAIKKGIKQLPNEIYELCLEIPKDGFETVFFETERDVTRPVYDWELEHSLGTYCENNGRLAFVDDYGRTFVTPYTTEVKEVLVASGYRKSNLFVPLSNGEKIVDPDINDRWLDLCSRIHDN